MDERQRQKNAGKPQPMSVYELHIGSWRRVPEENQSVTDLSGAGQ